MQPSGLTGMLQNVSAPGGCVDDEGRGLITSVFAVARKGGQHANTS
jgi:hypothetical protein